MSSWGSRLRAGDVALVDRATELAVIGGAIARAYAGSGAALIVVTGERGMGKSRLLYEISERARRDGALVLSGRAEPLRSAQGFGVLIELLRGTISAPSSGKRVWAQAAFREWCAQCAPGLDGGDVSHLGYLLGVVGPGEPVIHASAGNPRLIRDATWVAATRLIERAAATRSVLLAVDDLEWADDASAGLLAHLARRLADRRLAILASAGPDLDAVLPSLAADGAQLLRVELGPIPRGDARELARSAAGRSLEEGELDRIAEAAQGSPLVALELAWASGTHAEAGETLDASTMAEAGVEGLPVRARIGLALGALLGGRLWTGALEAMGVVGAEEVLGDLAERGLVELNETSRFEGEPQWELRRRLWGDQARARLAPEEVAAAHLAAGRWLRARGEDAAVVGEHLAGGGAGEEAAEVLEGAAEAAERAGALAAAQELAFRAAATGESGSARVRRLLLGIRQGVTGAVGRGALRAASEVLLGEAADDAVGRAAVAWGGGVLFLLGETSHAHVGRMAEAARRAAALGEVQTAAWAVRHAAFALSITVRQAEAEALLQEISARLDPHAPEVEIAVQHARGLLLLNGGRPLEALETLRIAFDHACAMNQRSVAVEIGSDYAYALLIAGDLDLCLEVIERAFEIADEAGSGLDQLFQNVIEHAAHGGPHWRMDTPLVRRAFARARAVPEADESRYGLLLRGTLLAFSSVFPGDPRALSDAEVLARYDALHAAAIEKGFTELTSLLEYTVAQVLLRRGEHEKALACAEAARQAAMRMDLGVYAIAAAFVVHEAAQAGGRADRALMALEEAAEELRGALARREGTRYARLFLEEFHAHRRILSACSAHGVQAPEAR